MSAKNSPKQKANNIKSKLIKSLFLFFLIIAAFFVGTFYPRAAPSTSPQPSVTSTPKEITEEVIPPIKDQKSEEKITDLRTLSKGFDLERSLEITKGGIATEERTSDESYVAKYHLQIKEPIPAQTVEQLSAANPFLKDQLTDLSLVLESAEVSPHFGKLQKQKASRTEKNSLQLLKLLTKHNYYDCQTILNLKHPISKRKAFLVQADMDVVADGSDGDRLSEMPDEIVNSTHYQPFTSYGWSKTSDTPNPMIEGWKERIKKANTEIAQPNTSATRKNWLMKRKSYLETGIADMKKRSFLIAEYDPFIVLPVPVIIDRKDLYAPKVGDYCVVFYKETAYPAIVGDAGPYFKAGEASLRIAKEIDPKSSPYRRPISELSATYLVFPNTAEKPNRAPDYQNIYDRCSALLTEFGGINEGVTLHKWDDLLPVKASPETAVPEELTTE